jgi:hypothetical protein
MMQIVPAVSRTLAHNPALIQHDTELYAPEKVLNDFVAQRLQPIDILEPFSVRIEITLSVFLCDKRLFGWLWWLWFFKKFNVFPSYKLYQSLGWNK